MGFLVYLKLLIILVWTKKEKKNMHHAQVETQASSGFWCFFIDDHAYMRLLINEQI